LKKNYFSSQKLPKQQSTSFWSQGILGIKSQKSTPKKFFAIKKGIKIQENFRMKKPNVNHGL
jgi:hypothetical protein